jgi:hypothetical protein
MTKKIVTIDFGAPKSFGAHVFRVDIPNNKIDPIFIVEDYGLYGGDGGLPNEELRAIIRRDIWSALSEIVRDEFNKRLKEKNLITSRWKSGSNILDRFLGQELCVLAWSSETAMVDIIPTICSRWLAFRPEERWWLFGMTVAEAGLPEDCNKGWRKALHFALSDCDKMQSVNHKALSRNDINISTGLSLIKD